ncbi:MAG: portal protein, partial [Terriglobus sp.]
FEQDIKIKRVRNPFTVYCDPNAVEPDYSDMDWGMIVSRMSKDAYKEAHPNSELANMQDWQSIGDTTNDWVERDSVRVVQYYWRESVKETLLQLRDGATILKSEVPEEFRELIQADVIAERDTEITKVKWAKLNGVEVLEETEWAGRWIPIIKVVGDEIDVDGKVILKGLVRDAKEPQRNFNFMKSAATEAIALAPKAPFVVADGQLAGYERDWQQANTKNFAFLKYKPVSAGGAPVPPPERMNAEPAIQAINMAMMESADDLKSVTGIYDASLGAQGNETSGKAILARQQQAQGSNFHFIDNLTRAIRHCGRVILDLIPKIYDTERVVRIIGMENDQKTVTINGQMPDQTQLTPDQIQALEKVYDVTVGKYDVAISTGPSYQSRRQEAVNSILDLVKSFPALMTMAGDILVSNMDWPGAKEIAKRLKMSLPPNLQNADQDTPLPPEVQQHLAQMAATVQQLQQELAAAQNDVQNSLSVKKLDTDSKERIAAGDQRIRELELQIKAAEVQATIVTALAKIDADKATREAQLAYERMGQIAGERHDAALETMKHEQQMERAEQSAGHAALASAQAAEQQQSQESQQ